MRHLNSLLAILLFSVSCVGQSNSDSNSVVVKALAKALANNYIFEDKALQMQDLLLKNLEVGSYAGLTGVALTDKLQYDARSVVDDKHLRVRFNGVRSSSSRRRTIPRYTHSIGKPEILENNIGYLEITGFQQPNNNLRSSLGKKMESLKDVDALIIDMRNNGGGSPAGVQLICSYFFSEEPGHLNTLYYRNRDFRKDFYTHEELDGPRLTSDPLYLLTSDYTFSGGEEFVYNRENLF